MPHICLPLADVGFHQRSDHESLAKVFPFRHQPKNKVRQHYQAGLFNLLRLK